jgi:hypothetical protein
MNISVTQGKSTIHKVTYLSSTGVSRYFAIHGILAYVDSAKRLWAPLT